MKKIITLLLALLMSACSAVKPAETLSSMQTEPKVETTITETAAPEETTESIPKETEPVIETPKTETIVSDLPEQKPVLDTTTETIAEAPIAPIKTETKTEPPATPKPPAEAVERKSRQSYRNPLKHRLKASQSRRKRSSTSTTGLTLQGPTRSKSGLKSTRQRWTAGTTRRPPTPTAFTLSGT